MVKPDVPFQAVVQGHINSPREVIVLIAGSQDIAMVTLPEKFCRKTELQPGDLIYVTPGKVEHDRCWAVYAALIQRPSKR